MLPRNTCAVLPGYSPVPLDGGTLRQAVADQPEPPLVSIQWHAPGSYQAHGLYALGKSLRSWFVSSAGSTTRMSTRSSSNV